MTPTRLPGVRFLAEPPRPDETLPRMDVAAFVGFAASGPLDTPVAIEDAGRFRDVFGGDLTLAWDAAAGHEQHAFLAPAVEAFFRAGGERCWVVRVAGAAETVSFPLPGLLAADALVASLGDVGPAEARARSAGSWAEGHAAGTVLHRRTLPLAPAVPAFAAGPESYRVDVGAGAGEVGPGDLLELVFGPGGPLLYLAVDRVTPRERSLRLEGSAGFWFSAAKGEALSWLTQTAGLSPEASVQALALPASDPSVRLLSLEILVWRGDELVRRLGDLGFAPDHPRYWARLPADDELYGLHRGEPAVLGELAREAAEPRFPLAGPEDDAARGVLYLPLRMASRPDPTLALAASPGAGETALERDGLAELGTGLFLDPDLAGLRVPTLLAEAQHKHSILGEPLRGIHSLLGVGEVTVLALPDAGHRGWERAMAETLPASPKPEKPKPAEPVPDFEDCETPPPEIPPEPAPPATVIAGRDWLALPPAGYDDDALLAVHRAALRFCAARGDLMAVLGLPGHYREEETLAHVRALAAGSTEASGPVPPLGFGENAVPSFGALYHPWLAGRGPGFTPPDGTICGDMASLTLGQGAWRAAANRSLGAAVALEPDFSGAAAERLLAARVNLIGRDPRGFMALGARTLGSAEVGSVPVRRMLILLRRLALREGDRFVFLPHDEDFRGLVRQRFERVLGDLYQRGALAGRTPAEAFRVVTGEAVNTPREAEAGRFYVELRVAPARPLEFLTVRLVESGPDLLTVQEV